MVELIAEFAVFWIVAYAAGVAIMFSVGMAIIQINKRHPERKIQKRQPTHSARKDIISSLKQIAVTATCLAIGFFSQWKGWTITPVELSWWSFPVFFAISVVLHDAWFYAGHRLLHTKALYRFHKPHHMTITPTVWSNDAGSSVDTLFAHSYYALVLFVIPMPALSLVGHRLFDQISAIIGHSGYEYFANATSRAPWPMICVTYHDQHHSEFVYNYANYFSWWDRIFGTIHPHYDRIIQKWEETDARPHMPKAKEQIDY